MRCCDIVRGLWLCCFFFASSSVAVCLFVRVYFNTFYTLNLYREAKGIYIKYTTRKTHGILPLLGINIHKQRNACSTFAPQNIGEINESFRRAEHAHYIQNSILS